MAGSSNFVPQWKRRRGEIAPSATETVFQIAASDFRSLKIIASFFNVTQDKTKQIDISIIKSDGSIIDQVTKIGGISIAVNSIVDGSDLKVQVTNNESYNLKYSLIFAKFQANF